jgi:hypothetical protein
MSRIILFYTLNNTVFYSDQVRSLREWASVLLQTPEISIDFIEKNNTGSDVYIYMYIYVCMCVCMCVCLCMWVQIKINKNRILYVCRGCTFCVCFSNVNFCIDAGSIGYVPMMEWLLTLNVRQWADCEDAEGTEFHLPMWCSIQPCILVCTLFGM